MANSQPIPSTSKQVFSTIITTKQNTFNEAFKLMLLELLFTRGFNKALENFCLKTGVTHAEKFGDIIFDEDIKSSHFIQINCLENPALNKIKSEDLFDGLDGRYSLLTNICYCIKLQEKACYQNIQKQNFYIFTNIPFDLNEQNDVKFMTENITQKQITVEELTFGVKHLMYIQTHQHNANYYRFVDEDLIDILFEQANKLKDTVTDPQLAKLLESLTTQSIVNVLKKIVFAVVNVELSELQNVVHHELNRVFKREVSESVQVELLKQMQDFAQNDSSSERTFDHANTFFNDNIKFGIQEGLHGNMFSVAVIMILFTRAYFRKLKNFTLETEVKEAAKFDDIVFSEGNQVFRFIQLKHKQDEKNEKMKASDLFDGFSENFSLLKYIGSYFIIKKNSRKFKIVKDAIVYTNIPFDLKNDKLELKVGNNQNNSKSFYGSHKEVDVEEIFLDETDILKFDDSSVKYYNFTDPRIIEILLNQRDSCINSIKNKDLKSVLSNLNEININEALQHIFYAVVQPNEQNTFDIVKEEIKKYLKLHNVDEIFLVLEYSILGWIAGKNTFDPKISFEGIEKFFQDRVKKVQFEVSPPISSFVGRDSEISAIRNSLNEGSDVAITHTQTVRIHGLGGVGKTELARKFVEKYKETDYFGRVIWIDAETQNSIKEKLERISQTLYLKIVENKNLSETDETKLKIDKILDYFNDFKILFVFDNVESNEAVDYVAYFRKKISTMSYRPYILITTRNNNYGGENLSHIDLNILNENEAIELLENRLSGKIDASEADLTNLANMLQCFPLALQQAIAYILVENEARQYDNQLYTIKDYIKSFETHEEAVKQLDFSLADDFGDKYTRTTYTTWKVTFDAIKNSERCGLDAITLLESIAYFAADDINFDLIKPLLQNSADIGHAIKLLKNYSLINESESVKSDNKTIFNIHRLVQKIVQINNSENKKEFKILQELLNTIVANKPWSSNNVDHCNQILSAATKNDEIVKEFYKTTFPTGWKLIHYAAYNNASNAIQILIEEKYDLNDKTKGFNLDSVLGETPLHIASQKGHLDLVTLLHKNGAIINEVDDLGRNSLFKAISSKKIKVVNYFIQNDDLLDIEDKKGKTALTFAVESGDMELVNLFISKGLSINVVDNSGQTLLHYGVKSSNLELVQNLIKKGISIDTIDYEGNTALHYAVWNENVDIVKILIEKGISIDEVDNEGSTALHHAVWKENCDIVRILIDKGISIDTVNIHGQSALQYAVREDNLDIVKILNEKKHR